MEGSGEGQEKIRERGMGPYFRPTVMLFVSMGLLLPLVGLFSSVTIRRGDLPGTDCFVFPLLHHGYGEVIRPFVPGSWGANFLLPAYLISVILNSLRGKEPAGLAVSALFFYLWIPLTAIVEVAADTLVPLLVSREGVPFLLLVLLVDVGFAGALGIAAVFARGSGGEW